jgi:response regulator of citrate/malate metabolism
VVLSTRRASQFRLGPYSTNPNQATPIIAVTAHADEKFMPNWRECGINKICIKPFLEAHFLQVMEEFVSSPVAG